MTISTRRLVATHVVLQVTLRALAAAVVAAASCAGNEGRPVVELVPEAACVGTSTGEASHRAELAQTVRRWSDVRVTDAGSSRMSAVP